MRVIWSPPSVRQSVCQLCRQKRQYLSPSGPSKVGYTYQRRNVIRKIATSSRQLRPISAEEIDISTNSPGLIPGPEIARVIPASPSYFTTAPGFFDELIHAQYLFRKYQTLPLAPTELYQRSAWKSVVQYSMTIGEPIRPKRYSKVLAIIQRLDKIHPYLMPPEVAETTDRYKREINPYLKKAKPPTLDEFGRSVGVGRRKESAARVMLVEGEGEVLINGKSITDVFPRIHDRESALWPLKITSRIDKYNVWALVKGGGSTGQAEAITLGLARALLVHEPLLKPALRRGKLSTKAQ